LIDAPLLGEVAVGVAGLWSLQAQGFSPDSNLLLVKAVYSDDLYPSMRSGFWTYDLTLKKYASCVNDLIASDRAIEVIDVSIGSFNGQSQLVAIYRDTPDPNAGNLSGLELNKVALIRNGVLIQSDLITQVSGNVTDALISAVKVSANGRFVAVETTASNLAADLDSNGLTDIYVFDLVLNTSRRITNVSGAATEFDSVLGDVMVGADGTLSVAFQSAQVFTTQDTNAADDVFVWRLPQSQYASPGAGTIELISRTVNGAVGGNSPLLDLNGVLFNSESGSFSSGDLNAANDVWQSVGSAVTLVSVSGSGSSTLSTTLASSSDGGRYVALTTAAPEIAGQTAVEQLVVVDTVAKTSTVVSASSAGVLADDAVISPVMSANGGLVAFSSQASTLGGVFDGQMHLYVANLQSVADATESVGKTADMLAYSWKAHTLLTGVSVSGGTHSGSSDAAGALSFTAVSEASLTLTASRAIPIAEATATSNAVNLQDAIAILKMIVGLPINGANQALSPYQALAADYDGDGSVGLTDAIGVLKHVVGLSAPDPTWHFLNEADTSVPGKANLMPGLPQTTVTADLSGTSPVHVGLVGYLSGDVDGSFVGAAGAQSLASSYFVGLSHSQFGF